MTEHFYVFADYTFADEVTQDDLAVLAELAASSRAEQGNVGFEVLLRIGEPKRVLLLERYVDAVAFEAHRASNHFDELVVQTIIPRLESRVVETGIIRPTLT
jgi:quinol monooxygenase YgiN